MSRDRLLSSLVSIAIVLAGIFFDWVFMVVIIGLTIGGLYEFFYMIKKKGIPIYSYIGIFIGVMIPLTIYHQFEITKNWELLFIVLMFLMVLLLQFARKENTNAVVGKIKLHLIRFFTNANHNFRFLFTVFYSIVEQVVNQVRKMKRIRFNRYFGFRRLNLNRTFRIFQLNILNHIF